MNNSLPLRRPFPLPPEMAITGDCFSGWALERHIVEAATKSGLRTTHRSHLGEKLYRFRHQGERFLLTGIVDEFAVAIDRLFAGGAGRSGLLVAVPVAATRRDYPRVVEFVTALSRQTGIAAAQHAVMALEKPNARKGAGKRTFAFASKVTASTFLGTLVLVVDDLYRSGRSLHAFCRFLKEQGGARDIRVLVGTMAARDRNG